MRYWEEMQSKWGFGDGDAVPADAGARRAVYVQGVNAVAEELGSEYRVMAWDRPGMHNWCLILNVPVGKDEPEWPEGSDEALERAIELAHEMSLDDYVRTEATVDQEALEDFLGNLEIPDEDA